MRAHKPASSAQPFGRFRVASAAFEATGSLIDVSLFKNAQLREGLRLQFRTEFINAFNHARFAAPNTTPTSTAFGAVTAESQWSRTIQFGLKLIF